LKLSGEVAAHAVQLDPDIRLFELRSTDLEYRAAVVLQREIDPVGIEGI
jgi:hypothetical protein